MTAISMAICKQIHATTIHNLVYNRPYMYLGPVIY